MIKYPYHLDLKYNITLILFITISNKSSEAAHSLVSLFCDHHKRRPGHAEMAQPLTLGGH